LELIFIIIALQRLSLSGAHKMGANDFLRVICASERQALDNCYSTLILLEMSVITHLADQRMQ